VLINNLFDSVLQVIGKLTDGDRVNFLSKVKSKCEVFFCQKESDLTNLLFAFWIKSDFLHSSCFDCANPF
jgi:hypothetical protein